MDREQAKQLLADVLALIEDMQVPQDLRPAAFQQLWAGLSPPPVALKGPEPEHPAAPEPLLALAKRLDLEPVYLADLYAVTEDGTLDVQVPASSLPEQKTAATKELALLVCAGRQATCEETTAAATIREVCNRYSKLDPPNFAAALKEADHLLIIGGPARQRTYRLRQPGWEQAKEVVKRIADIS